MEWGEGEEGAWGVWGEHLTRLGWLERGEGSGGDG